MGCYSVAPQLKEKLKAFKESSSAMKESSNDQENADPNVRLTDDLLRAAQLKKKEVPQSKNLKRKKYFLDKLQKGKRKATKPAVSTKKRSKGMF